ncbi:hypothetical protein R1sor_022783 [Riccia sorocarpa]|uniref:PilZ domain-containing protein n=1 Tax=Riccia sorocarpa TaxID=122646 RepID=A0ABD3GMX5_9MARC
MGNSNPDADCCPQQRSAADRWGARSDTQITSVDAIRVPDRICGRDPAQMAKKKRPPHAPPAAAARRKKAQETSEHASGAGPSEPPKGAKRGGPKEPVDQNAIEAPYLVEFEVIPDPDRRICWGHVDRSGRNAALEAVRVRDISAFGLSVALDLPIHRPHIPACLEFIQSAVTVRQERETRDRLDLPMEDTVRGWTVRSDAALVREAFLLPTASLEIKRQVRHSLISDWFPEYERSGKRYSARTCRHKEWAATLECINRMLLASRRPRTIPGRLVYYIKNFQLDPQDEPEQRFDFADLMAHSLRREVFAVHTHLQADKPERYLETFVAIQLTHILLHLQLLTSRECDAPRHPQQPQQTHQVLRPSEDPATQGLGLREMERQRARLIVEINRLELSRAKLAGEVVELSARARLRTRVISPSGPRMKFLIIKPQGFFFRLATTVGVEAAKAKGFDVLSCSRSPSKNVLPTINFVRAHRRSMDGIVEPILVLHDFWGETPQPIDRFIIWSDVPSATRDLLLAEWSHFFEHAERTVEEAPAEEATLVEEVAAEETTRIEEARASVPTPVEGASAEEATRVEEAPVEEATVVEEIPLAIPIPVEAIPLGATHE